MERHQPIVLTKPTKVLQYGVTEQSGLLSRRRPKIQQMNFN